MDFQTLQYFVAAAETGSFSAAAERCHYAQSNLSARIKQLEAELEEPLFYRNTRGVSLTAKGEVYYDYALQILRLSKEAQKAVHDMEHARGALTIGSLEATALGDLPELLSSYHRLYPEVKLSVKTDMNDMFLDPVLDRAMDGAFVSGPVSRPELKEVPFKEERLLLVGGREAKGLDAWEVLSGASLITFPEGSVFRHRMELLLASKSIPYQDRLSVLNSLGAMIAGICAGIGFGYLPESIVAPYLEKGQMVSLPTPDSFAKLSIVFLYRSDHILDAAFRFFLQMVEEMGKRKSAPM